MNEQALITWDYTDPKDKDLSKASDLAEDLSIVAFDENISGARELALQIVPLLWPKASS